MRIRFKPYLLAGSHLGAVLLAAWSALQGQSDRGLPVPQPPVAPVKPVIDAYYGTKISDPYRYMEDLKDSQVQAWMKAQNDYTRAVLGSIPGRQQMLQRIAELRQSRLAHVWSAQRLPGDVYVYLKRKRSDSVAKLYWRQGLNGEEKLLADSEKIRTQNQAKGANAIAYFAVSDDARYAAIGVTPGGSENDTEIHVFETLQAAETGDVIPRAEDEGDLHWLPDNRSFVYGQQQKLAPGAPVTDLRQKYRSYLHVLGRKSEDDPPVFGCGVIPSISVDPRHFGLVQVHPNSAYAIGVVSTGVSPNSRFYIAPLHSLGVSDARWRKIADFSDDVSDVAINGNDLYLLTYKDAPRYNVVRMDARNPDLASAATIIPTGEAVIISIAAAQDGLYVKLQDGGIGRLLRVPYNAGAKAERVDLPFEGAIYDLSSEPRVPGVLFEMTSWTKAFRIHAYDPLTKRVADTRLQPLGPHDDPSNIESEEVRVRSYDGTLVPLSIVHSKEMKRDGSNPTILYGYGGYGISNNPNFDPVLLAWHEKSGIFAVCHARGGGEYGEEWHLAGKGPTKPNTWRDFIACGEYLVNNRYTSPERLSGAGGSAGGILIGRAITERPDLFVAADIQVGLLDALRNETTANGVPNIPELGSTKTEAGFQALYAMSAYHHVENGTRYPAVLIETGINDPRVDPWESAKMTARLQAATISGKPILLRVDYAGGHGGIGATERQAEERFADWLDFLLWQFGVADFQPRQ